MKQNNCLFFVGAFSGKPQIGIVRTLVTSRIASSPRCTNSLNPTAGQDYGAGHRKERCERFSELLTEFAPSWAVTTNQAQTFPTEFLTRDTEPKLEPRRRHVQLTSAQKHPVRQCNGQREALWMNGQSVTTAPRTELES